jgi:hypothetical protein
VFVILNDPKPEPEADPFRGLFIIHAHSQQTKTYSQDSDILATAENIFAGAVLALNTFFLVG